MIKVIAIEPTSKAGISRIVFQNADELAVSLGLQTKMMASKPAFDNKNALAEGQIINGYHVEKKSFDAPQYTDHKPFETDGKYYSAVVVNSTTGAIL